MDVRTVSVIGLGYIGLPTAAVIASRGIRVYGVEVNPETVDIINQGNIHIKEPDLDIVVRSVVTTGMLSASTQAQAADVFLIAVPTPFKSKHRPDLSFIKHATQLIAPVLEKGNLVILESTSPVGTTEQLADWLAELRPDLSFPQQVAEKSDIHIAHCPERVLPGQVLHELVSNDRVIGGMTKRCALAAEQLYACFVRGACLLTGSRTAELAKLTENAYRDVNIAFANELSIICDELRVNVWELIALANRHPRVNVLSPGPGVGGHCIAVDPWFIVDSAPQQAKLIRTAREVNDGKPAYILDKVKSAANQFKKPVFACLGISFKADIDDTRESPALVITKALVEAELGMVYVVEPNLNALPEQLNQPNVELTSLDRALEQANIVLVLVDHREFKLIPVADVNSKLVIDTRGIW